MSRYFTNNDGLRLAARRRRLHMPSGKKRKPPGRPKHIRADDEEKFFLVANLMWGEPEVGKGVEELRKQFAALPEFVLKIRNVKPWLLRSERGRAFIALALRHGYFEANVFNLYRRYANWYFRQEVKHAHQATP